jgi:hypothetical protein
MTASTRTGRRLRWSQAGRLLAVVTLALAVIGMHSMGAGHLDLMADGTHGMTQQVAAVTSSSNPHPHPGTDMAPQAARTTNSTTSPAVAAPPGHAQACPGSACSGVDPAGHRAGHDMTAMCLAVLPGLLLLLTWLLLGRSPAAVVAGTAWRALTSPIRAGPPPPHLTPSLSKLCILRT